MILAMNASSLIFLLRHYICFRTEINLGVRISFIFQYVIPKGPRTATYVQFLELVYNVRVNASLKVQKVLIRYGVYSKNGDANIYENGAGCSSRVYPGRFFDFSRLDQSCPLRRSKQFVWVQMKIFIFKLKLVCEPIQLFCPPLGQQCHTWRSKQLYGFRYKF